VPLLKPITLYGKPPKDGDRRYITRFRKQDGSWVKSEKERAEIFAEHFSKIFKPNSKEITQQEENVT